MGLRVLLFGPRGAGKTTLAFNFYKYLEKRGFAAGVANLDPFVRSLSFPAAWDCRDYLPASLKRESAGREERKTLAKAYEALNANRRALAGLQTQARSRDYLVVKAAGSIEDFLFTPSAASLLSKAADAAWYVTDATGENEGAAAALAGVLEQACGLPSLAVLNQASAFHKTRKPAKLGAEGDWAAFGGGRVVRVSAVDRIGFDELAERLARERNT